MKKNLFFISVAVLALSSCNNDTVVDENPAANQPKEIAIQAITTPTTRAAVDGTTFPTDVSFLVTAFDAENNREFFGETEFEYSSGTWKAGKYWPLSAAHVNFLAIANNGNDAVGWVSGGRAGIEVMDNSEAQLDLMYAVGSGAVTQSDNTLSVPTSAVSMVFHHAQAWINFTVSGTTQTDTAITVNSITLNNAKYGGVIVIENTKYNTKNNPDLTASWSEAWEGDNTDAFEVPNWTAAKLSTTAAPVGDGLLIVPDPSSESDFDSFTINYTLNGNTYDYTYVPASRDVAMGKLYTYNIKFKLTEIEIAATVTNWDAQEGTPVNIPEVGGQP